MLKNLRKLKSMTSSRKNNSVSKRLLSDNTGIAAIEFALIAPIMIGLYFGLSEISMIISADRAVSHSTSVAGDLATQSASINQAEIEDIMTATLAVLNITPNQLSNISVELNSYAKCANDDIINVGYSRLGDPITAGGPETFDPSTLSNNMLNPNSGVVVARINRTYQPLTYFFVNNMTLNETFALKPRQSPHIPFGQNGDNVFTCTANADLTVSCTASSGPPVPC